MDFIPYLFFINVIFFVLAILCFICLHMLWDRHIGANAKLVFLRKKVDGIPSEQEWRDSVTDKKLEEELEEYILNPERRGELLDEIRSANIEMPCYSEGDNIPLLASEVETDFSRFSDDRKRRIAADNRKQVLRVLMALRGKLLVDDVENGVEFQQRDTDDYSKLPSGFKKDIDVNKNFILWILSELEEHGVEVSLSIKSGDATYPVGRFSTAFEPQNISGQYIFTLPMPEPERCPICQREISDYSIFCRGCLSVIRKNVNLSNVFGFICKVSGVLSLILLVIDNLLLN